MLFFRFFCIPNSFHTLSHKTNQSERNCVVNAKRLEDKENSSISTNFEITPVKSMSKSVKFRASKRRDSSLDSPTRKRMNTAPKTLVFYDERVRCYDWSNYSPVFFSFFFFVSNNMFVVENFYKKFIFYTFNSD